MLSKEYLRTLIDEKTRTGLANERRELRNIYGASEAGREELSRMFMENALFTDIAPGAGCETELGARRSLLFIMERMGFLDEGNIRILVDFMLDSLPLIGG